jgi:hypothetical protein
MRLSTGFNLLSLIILFFLLNLDSALCQESGKAGYQFCSPVPNSTGINPETAIIIRYGKTIDLNTLDDDLLEVTGEISGKHNGKFSLNKDHLTLTYKSDKCFAICEQVKLQLIKGIKTVTGEELPAFSYSFTIRQKPGENFNIDFFDDSQRLQDKKTKSDSMNSTKGNPISFSDIPEPIIYYSNGATAGNIMTILEKPPTDYLYLFNNSGTLLTAKKTPHRVSNFKPHSSGIATYFDHTVKGHIIIDPFLNNVDTLFMKNGYKPDAHDILLLENGHIIMEAYDPQLVDMSKITEGGNPNATVIGFVIQELDENKNLIFEWRSWDHFRITDSYNDLLSSVVEYVHGNSLDADTDSTLIFSSRNLNEITKINRKTGKIIWRLGGKNNQFVFQNDTRGFSAQHSAMKQKNGNLTLFDNGNGFEPIFSRGIEYKIDELNKTVTLINEYRHDPDIFAYVTGNLQRLNNGNTFIFWGSIVGQTGHIITEYNPSGKMTFEVRFDLYTYPTYTAYRTNWNHKIFRLSSDTVNFVQVSRGDSIYRDVNVTNLTNKSITITSAYGHNNGFKINNLPVTIPALETKILTAEFRPKSVGSYSDILTLCQETDSSIIAKQLVLKGESVIKTGIQKDKMPDFEIYPNPVKNILEIKSFKMINAILICDVNGRIINKISKTGMTFSIDMESVAPGFYIVAAIFSDKTRSVKEIVKQ